MIGVPSADYQDWAPYPDVEQAAAAYLRDPEIAMDALRRVIDFATITAFTMERTVDEEESPDALYQEIAITDGRVLLLWIGNDVIADDDDPTPGVPLMTSTLRSIPLSALIDRILKITYRVDDGGRTLHSVELRLVTSAPDYTVATSASRTDAYSEELCFTKSVIDGGRAQMERLIQFGRATTAHG